MAECNASCPDCSGFRSRSWCKSPARRSCARRRHQREVEWCSIGNPMTRLLLSAFATVLLASPLSEHDREFGVNQLHATRKMFTEELAPVSTAQWNFKPAPDRWSVGEIAEHIALSEDMIYSLITEEIIKSPADPGKRAAPPVTDAYVHERDRSEEHTSELQSPCNLVCRLLLEK